MKIKIVVDKRTLVMEVLLKLTNYFTRYPNLNVSFNFQFNKDVENYFEKYKNHKAVKMLQKIIDNTNFCYGAPISLALKLNEDFTYDANKLKEYILEDQLKKDKGMLEFLLETKNFVEDTNFKEFYNQHKNQFNEWIKSVKDRTDDNLIDYLNAFYKEDLKKKYIINLLPLQTNANYGSRIGNKSYCNLGVKIGKDGKVYFLGEYQAWLLHHEFSHPIINPLTDKYFDYNKMPKLPAEVITILINSAYGEGFTYVKEQVVRATDIIYGKHIWGRKISEEERIKKEAALGFIHTRRVLKALKKYQKQNEPMSTYYPKILEEFYKPLTEKDYDVSLLKK